MNWSIKIISHSFFRKNNEIVLTGILEAGWELCFCYSPSLQKWISFKFLSSFSSQGQMNFLFPFPFFLLFQEVRVDFFFHFMPLQTITGPAGVLPSGQDRKSNSGQWKQGSRDNLPAALSLTSNVPCQLCSHWGPQVIKNSHGGDFPGGPMAKSPSCNAGDAGSIPGLGTRIPHAAGQLSPCATPREPTCCNYRAHMLWTVHAATGEALALQWRARALQRKIPLAATKTQRSQ